MTTYDAQGNKTSEFRPPRGPYIMKQLSIQLNLEAKDGTGKVHRVFFAVDQEGETLSWTAFYPVAATGEEVLVDMKRRIAEMLQ